MFNEAQLRSMEDKAESLIGTPFKSHAREGSGFIDCYGLVLSVYLCAGVVLPDITEDIGSGPRSMFREVSHPQSGDIVEYRSEASQTPHICVAFKKPSSTVYIYSATDQKGVCCLPVKKSDRLFAGYSRKSYRLVSE